MCKPQTYYFGTMLEYLNLHKGELKQVNTWADEINELLPKNRRKTPRELGRIFAVIRKKGLMIIERSCDCSYRVG